MSIKIGSIVLATEQGLGYLARDMYKHGIIDVVWIQPHSSRINHYEWYPDRLRYKEDLLECDVLLFIETPFDLDFMKQAKSRGIKIVFMPMYECSRPEIVKLADVIISPSALDQQYYPNSTLLPVPINVRWKLRETAKVFIHNAGNGGLGGRNGTKELVDAIQYVKSPIKLVIRSQIPLGIKIHDPRIEYRVGSFDDIWSEGDVFVFPEKFNGLSLPLQEAFASGMLVMCGDRFPMNTWLPKEPLIPISGYKKERIAIEFDSAVIDPKDIAKCIDCWYNKDISSFSLQGKAYNEANQWNKEKFRAAMLQ